MAKNLILTICVGDTYQRMGNITHPRQKSYAQKIGADYLVIDSSTKSSPHWEKFQIYDLLIQYERILFIDTDILVRDDAPNLFNIVPKNVFGAFNEAPFTPNRNYSVFESAKAYNLNIPTWNGKYFNTGLMVISRCHRELFKHPGKEIFNFFEQGYLNAKLQSLKYECMELPYKYNRMTCMDVVTGEERFASYFMHYAGMPYFDYTLNVIQKDDEKWKQDSPNYNYKRHILIDVQGGLGDQVQAEPTIRFMQKYIYPNEDITIKTHYPRLFQHLGLPVYLHEEFQRKNDTPYYHVVTLPGPETLQWTVVSNLLCHTVDFISMACLRRILPFKDKMVHLTINDTDIEEVKKVTSNVSLKDHIVIHAGKHWESKTFPKQWWQDVVDGLLQKGHKIILIGKDEETRGVWDLDVKDGVIDARNLLSLGGLIALLSQCKLLISNDSAPIHIAGAFTTPICLIPTCKHPEHVLPFSPNGKQIALYKKLTLDDCPQSPTEVHGATGEFIAASWDNYILDVDEFINKIQEWNP